MMTNEKPLLILLPFAGGNAYSYRAMLNSLQINYTLLTPELPGRGALSNQPLIGEIDKLVDYLFKHVIKPLNLTHKYVLYGHSMGALLVYLLAHKIKQNNLPSPDHLIISGRNAPFIKRDNPIHHLPSDDFWASIQSMGGVPLELLQNEELKTYFEPIIRNDFKVVENYNYSPPIDILDLPMTVIYGDQENMTKQSIEAWQQENKQLIKLIEMTGNHFFIFDQTIDLVNYMNSVLPH